MTHVDPMLDKPFSPACERNRDPILAVLREQFADRHRVLEIGSGTGQHAAYFAAAMPWLTWQCSDVARNLPAIRAWLDEASLPNTPAPIELDVMHGSWPTREFDAVFSANTLHIMGWGEVEAFFAAVDRVLGQTTKEAGRGERFVAENQKPPSSAPCHVEHAAPSPTKAEGTAGLLIAYGPFNYRGAYTSDSNREFDVRLKTRDPRSGIRDFEAVDLLARAIGLQLREDIAMPANNRCLVWQRG
jgi:SAM-dependent methyltransferase